MREQKLSGAYKLADNRPTSPVDAHAHETATRAPMLDLLRYLRAMIPAARATCLPSTSAAAPHCRSTAASRIDATLNKLPDYLRNEVFKGRPFRCHFLISIYKPVSCTLSALRAHSMLPMKSFTRPMKR